MNQSLIIKNIKSISLMLFVIGVMFVLHASDNTTNIIVNASEYDQSVNSVQSADSNQNTDSNQTTDSVQPSNNDNVRIEYNEYLQRLDSITSITDISTNGFRIISNQIFPIELARYGEVSLIPAFERKYNRLALFFADENEKVIYKTEQLEANHRVAGQMKQPACDIAAVSFRDLDQDGRMDIILITACADESGYYGGATYKLGDVLFQKKNDTGFYRDYRIADKINRFGMSKSAEMITAFVRDDRSTEFLYTATTLRELQSHGLYIITDQCYFRDFEKLGRLQVVPGTYRISNYDVFMIFLVNEQGNIVSSLQPMGDYDNLYALKGIQCRDIDGDSLKDIVILARYSYEGEEGQLVVESDYSIYYQRTGGFSADTDIKNVYKCGDDDTMELLVEKARAYWGWQSTSEVSQN